MAETKVIRAQAGFQEKFVRSNIDFVLGGGVLNPQPYDSMVATPNGFVKISELKPGDEILDTKGGTQHVNYIIDKGEIDCVEFTFRDGRKAQSALSHNWLCSSPKKILKQRTAEEIIEHMDRQEGKSKKHIDRIAIPMCAAVQHNDAHANARTIHPYVLGCIIGDGWFSATKFYTGFSNRDEDIINRIKELGYNIKKERPTTPDDLHYEIRNKDLKEKARDLGLLGKYAKDKFIPDCYKYAPINDRLELIKGLFDTDGTCAICGGKIRCGYITTSKQLANDIREIIWSLGGRCSLHINEAKRAAIKGVMRDCSETYLLTVTMPNDKDLFYLPRKKNRAKGLGEKKNSHKLSIVDYKLIGKKHCYCINVSGEDHLYLTDNYIVTCNCGKSFAAVLSVAEPSHDSRFRGLFLRNNLGDARASGGLLDTFREVYADGVEIVESGEPRVTFPSGAKIDVTHVSDQTRERVMQRFKGRQYDFIYFDEGTGFTWECFTAIYSRNRGQASWTGKVRMTTNPDRNHWLRTFIDWYIGYDGFIREDREGVVRYFYIAGESVKDVVWGDSKLEVYKKCKLDIDRKLAKINGATGTSSYEDMIKSFTFYLGRMSENKASIGNNSGYAGSVAVTGGRMAEQLLEGNWNVSPDDAVEAEIPTDLARQVLLNDPQVNGDRWITADLADVGTDNFVAFVWDGFHIFDKLVLSKTTPRENAENLILLAKQYNISNSHIIYDATRARYINDYIPEAIPFISSAHTRGMYGRMALRLKDECYMRLIQVIKHHNLSMSDKIADSVYAHQNLRNTITIANEFTEECSVVAFKEVQSGKKTLLSKKEMNLRLGRGRSMDVLDPMAMRMLPVLEYPYGEELERSAQWGIEYNEEGTGSVDIHDDSFWC